MNQKFVYPALPSGLETRLGAIVVAARGAKGYLEDGGCPYSDEMKSFLKLMLGGSKRERVKVETEELDESADKYDRMIASNSRSRNLLDVHGLSPAFMRSGGIEKVARDWRKTSQEGK